VEGLSCIRESGGGLEIGAMTRQRDLEFSEVVRARAPLMDEAIRHVGHRQTRNRGTLGGSLCHLDPSAELVSVAAALDATVIVTGPKGQREIPFAAFPVAFMTPAIEPDELLTAVRFPDWPKGHGHAFIEFARRHGDFAIVSAAALITEDAGGRIARASVAIGGMGTVPIRVAELERALIGQPPDDKFLREACEACRKLDAIDDVHAPASYRQHLAAVLSRRALEQARARLPSRAAAH
jgi:carbon-monoxide dehydrogenase medium subunit